MSVIRGIKLLLVMIALFVVLALLLPYLLAWRSIGLPFQHGVMLFQPMLEDAVERYPLTEDEKITGLIVLGGHTSRITAAEKLLAQFPGSRAIFSGPRFNEVELVNRMGISPDRIIMDDRPANTYENAYFTNALGVIKPGEKWLLVTSALHMPRALGAFRALCLKAHPWPVRDALPQPHVTAPVVYREMAAFFVYFLRGRISLYAPHQNECVEQ